MHAHSLIEPSMRAKASPSVATSTADVNPLRASRISWIALDTWTVRDNQDRRDIACALLTPVGHPGDPAEQAMPALAEAFGLDPRPGARTYLPDNVYVTLSEHPEQPWITLHIGTDLTLRRQVQPPWQQTASTRGWVRVVIGYRATAADADTAEYLDDALTGHGVTADVPVRAAHCP